jgi:DNA-binding LacI/PurR family transcriptional regulator
MKLVVQTDFTKENTIEAIRHLLSFKNRPDAIISFNDYVHMDASQYAFQQGIDINKEIAFISYANLPITKYTAFPPLLSLEQYPYGQGECAMQMMIRRLDAQNENEEESFDTEELSATLVTPR